MGHGSLCVLSRSHKLCNLISLVVGTFEISKNFLIFLHHNNINPNIVCILLLIGLILYAIQSLYNFWLISNVNQISKWNFTNFENKTSLMIKIIHIIYRKMIYTKADALLFTFIRNDYLGMQKYSYKYLYLQVNIAWSKIRWVIKCLPWLTVLLSFCAFVLWFSIRHLACFL